MNIAIILAGGKGKRLAEDTNKCFLPLGNQPLISHCIGTFEKCPEINKVLCIVGDDSEILKIEEISRALPCTKLCKVLTTGGPQRQDGAFSAIQWLSEEVLGSDFILIHNGANPFISASEISSVISAAETHGASVCAQPVKDTVKEADDDLMINKTLDRSRLWQMQTPQCMRFDIAKKAFGKAYEDDFYGTDDVQLVERIGLPVKIVECSYQNFKITTQQDLRLAELILGER